MENEQEMFWKNEFGNDYIDRNNGIDLLACKIAIWSEILHRTTNVRSCMELGCNIGLNLKAIKTILPHINYVGGVEINNNAVEILKKEQHIYGNNINIYEDSILNVHIDEMYDLSFTMGVLIHMNPGSIDKVYSQLYDCSRKYIVICEYYNPTPVEIPYRGHDNKLFKRDFAGEFLDKYDNTKLVDYGFIYHRDNNFPLDDATWFLMEKN